MAEQSAASKALVLSRTLSPQNFPTTLPHKPTTCYDLSMFNIGFAEFMMIGVLALVLLGPDQLPSAIRSLAKFIRDIRKTTSQLKEQIDPEFDSVTRDLRDAMDGDIEAPIKPFHKKGPHLNKPEKAALPESAPPPTEPEELIVQAPSEEEGRPIARGAAYQPEPTQTPAVPASNEETKA
jgi:sec-independent protein translocase protein TatB